MRLDNKDAIKTILNSIPQKPIEKKQIPNIKKSELTIPTESPQKKGKSFSKRSDKLVTAPVKNKTDEAKEQILMNHRRFTYGYSLAKKTKFWANFKKKKEHRGTFITKVPPLIGLKRSQQQADLQNDDDQTEAEGDNNSITNVKIDEVSNEVEESNDQRSKSEPSEDAEDIIESTSSHESDYINEKSNKYHMNIVESKDGNIRKDLNVKIEVITSSNPK